MLVYHVVVVGEAEGGKARLDCCGGHVGAGTVAVKDTLECICWSA